MHRIILTIFIAALSTVQLFSQQINGIILNDENNKPIPDANISIINSNKGTVSNEKGGFAINYSEKDISELLISCLGFESIRLKLFRESAKNTLTIKLQPTTIQLNPT
mgnify:CR=1 FL=1